MKCKKAEKLILKYQGEEKPPRKIKSLKKHLAQCRQCLKYKDRVDMIFGSIDNCDISAPAPEGFTERTTARAWLSPPETRPVSRRFVLAAVAGAAAAILLLFTLVPHRSEEEVVWMASGPNAEKMLTGYKPNSRFYSESNGYIKLNLRSDVELKGVTVNIKFPDGLELYDGRNSIDNWKVDLNRGDNVVFLKVKPRHRGLWKLEGVIEKDGATSSFSKEIEVI